MAKRIEDIQEEMNQRARERAAAAQERFAESHRNAVMRSPSSYSVQEREAARKYLEEQEKARQFDEAQETQRLASENEMKGKIGYGSEAAKETAAANKEIAATEWGAKTTISEQEAAAKKYLGELEAASKEKEIAASKEIADKQGEWGVKKQAEANKGQVAVAEVQSMTAALDRDSRERIAKLQAGGKVDAAKIASVMKTAQEALKNVTDPKERQAILAGLSETFKNDPDAQAVLGAMGGGGQGGNAPKEGERRQFAEGWFTFKNGDWVAD